MVVAAGVDSQRHRNGENSAQILNDLCFSVLCINVRIQRFYYEVIEKAADRSQPTVSTGHSPSGQIIGSIEKTGVRFPERKQPSSQSPAAIKSASSARMPANQLFRFLVFIFLSPIAVHDSAFLCNFQLLRKSNGQYRRQLPLPPAQISASMLQLFSTCLQVCNALQALAAPKTGCARPIACRLQRRHRYS